MYNIMHYFSMHEECSLIMVSYIQPHSQATPSFSMLYTENQEGLVCDVIVTMSCVGGARITKFQGDNSHSLDFQPKVK